MINNYFLQINFPQEANSFKVRVQRKRADVLGDRPKGTSKERGDRSRNCRKVIDVAKEKMHSPKYLNRYMELIDKRSRKSFINATYAFPRESEQRSETPRSVRSMNGVVIYKLTLQNKPPQTVDLLASQRQRNITNKTFFKQKIFIRKPVRKGRILTESSASRDRRTHSKISVVSLSEQSLTSFNPLRNSMLSRGKVYQTCKPSNASHISSRSNNH